MMSTFSCSKNLETAKSTAFAGLDYGAIGTDMVEARTCWLGMAGT